MPREDNVWQAVAKYSSLAFVLPASTFVGYAIGWALDRAFGTSFLYLVFLLLGIVSGFVQVIRQLQKDTKNADGS